jgi:hypothetical protein
MNDDDNTIGCDADTIVGRLMQAIDTDPNSLFWAVLRRTSDD